MGQGQSDITANAIMLGNPGAGKSTLLNCLSDGQARFKAGFSRSAKGVTEELAETRVNFGGRVVNFMDVPGLEDPQLRQKACDAIHDAMNRPGEIFKIIFLIGLESGRVREQDITTINLVLKTSPDIGVNYGIIINKLSKRAMRTYSEDPEALQAVLFQLSADPISRAGVRATPNFHFLLPNNTALGDEDDMCIRLPDHDKLLAWINSVPNCTIRGEVHKIEADKFDAMKQVLQEEMKKIREDADYARAQQQEAERLRREEVQNMRDLMKTQQDAFRSSLEEQQRQAEIREEFERTKHEENQRLQELAFADQKKELRDQMQERQEEMRREQRAALAAQEQRMLSSQREQKEKADKEKERTEAAQLNSKGVPASHVISMARKEGRSLNGRIVGGDSNSPYLDNDLQASGTEIEGQKWTAVPASALAGGALQLVVHASAADTAAAGVLGAGVDVLGVRVGGSTISGVFGGLVSNIATTDEDRLRFRFGGQSISLRVAK